MTGKIKIHKPLKSLKGRKKSAHGICFRSAPKEFLTGDMGPLKKHECCYTQYHLYQKLKAHRGSPWHTQCGNTSLSKDKSVTAEESPDMASWAGGTDWYVWAPGQCIWHSWQ